MKKIPSVGVNTSKKTYGPYGGSPKNFPRSGSVGDPVIPAMYGPDEEPDPFRVY